MHGMAQTSDYLGALSLSGGPLQVVLGTFCTVTAKQAGSILAVSLQLERPPKHGCCLKDIPNSACLAICGLRLHFPGSMASRVYLH